MEQLKHRIIAWLSAGRKCLVEALTPEASIFGELCHATSARYIMAKSLPTAWEALKWRGTSAFGFHGKRHPGGLNAGDVEAFLSHLAVKGQVAASTQNQALVTLLFL